MHADTWRQVGPVLLSILIILAVAVLRNHSRVLAGILGTMPISIRQYTDTLPFGILGTVAFILAVWLAARAGWKLLPMLAVGYVTWGVTLVLIFALKQWLRF